MQWLRLTQLAMFAAMGSKPMFSLAEGDLEATPENLPRGTQLGDTACDMVPAGGPTFDPRHL